MAATKQFFIKSSAINNNNSNNLINLASNESPVTSLDFIKKNNTNLGNVRCLLSFGADPNYVSEKETFKRSPLIYATFIKDENWAISVAQNLIESGADIKKTDSRFLTPLHYCCAFGREKLLEVFLKSLDFDLSKSVDLNGNTCMHYAVRSHSLSCVNLLIKYYKKNNMTNRLDSKNVFGLKPTDLEDEDFIKDNRARSYYPGTDSLEDCKKSLQNYIHYVNELKKMAKKEPVMDYFKMPEPPTKDKRRKSSKKSAIKKNRSKSAKKDSDGSKKSSTDRGKSTSRESLAEDTIPEEENSVKSGSNQKFFATQIDDDICTITPKPFRPQSALNSKTNLKLNLIGQIKLMGQVKMRERAEPRKPDISQERDLIRTTRRSFSTNLEHPVSNDSNKPIPVKKPIVMDKEKAKKLTTKSFPIILKDLLENYLEYNSLFFAKEHMIQSKLKENNEPKPPAQQVRSTSSFTNRINSSKSTNLERKSANIRLNGRRASCFNYDSNDNSSDDTEQMITKSILALPNDSFVNTNWKRELPTVFNTLENFLTPSYRETINPPVSNKSKSPQKLYLEYKMLLKRSAGKIDPNAKKSNNIIITMTPSEDTDDVENATKTLL